MMPVPEKKDGNSWAARQGALVANYLMNQYDEALKRQSEHEQQNKEQMRNGEGKKKF